MPMSEKDRNTRDLCRRQSPPSLVSSPNPATWCKWRLGITGREISVWRIWVLVWGGVKHIYFCASFFPERVWVFVIFPLSIAAEKKKKSSHFIYYCVPFACLRDKVGVIIYCPCLSVCLAGWDKACVGYSQWVSNLFHYWFSLRESFY